MSWVAVAAAVVGGYASYEGGRQQARAADKASEAYGRVSGEAAARYQPYIDFGAATLPYLQYYLTGEGQLQDPQKIAQYQEELAQLETQKQALEEAGQVYHEIAPVPTGKKAHQLAISGKPTLAAPPIQTNEYTDVVNRINELKANLEREQKAPAPIEPSPLYKFQQREGIESINKALAARGLYGSGAGIKSHIDFQSRLGAEEVERQYNRLLGAANVGLGAAGAATGAGYTGAGGQAQAAYGKGAAQAALYSNIGNIAIAGLGAYQQQQGYNRQQGIYNESLYKNQGGYGPYQYPENYNY